MQQLTKKTLGSIIARLKKGSTLGKETKALGLSGNGPLRRALIQHLGGKPAYDALMTKSREKRRPSRLAGGKKDNKTAADEPSGDDNSSSKGTLIDVEIDDGSSDDDEDEDPVDHLVGAIEVG